MFSFGLRLPYSRWSDAVLTFLRDVCEPYLRLFRRFIPPIGMFDFSPMIAIIVLYIVRTIVVNADLGLTGRVDGDRSEHIARTSARPRSLAWSAVAAAVVALDQLTKHTGQRPGSRPATLDKFLPASSSSTSATPASPSACSPGGGTLVLVFTLVALAVLLVYFTVRPTRPWLWLPTGLLIGGAIGNLIDRIAHGAVTDFIKLPHWPAFNVADMAITFGVIALLFVLEGPRTDAR